MSAITFESATHQHSLQVAVGDVLRIHTGYAGWPKAPGRVTAIEDGKWRFSEKRKVTLVCDVVDPDGGTFESITSLHPDQPEYWPRAWTPDDEADLIANGYGYMSAAELSGNSGQLLTGLGDWATAATPGENREEQG